MTKEKKVVQNNLTPLDETPEAPVAGEHVEVCREVTEKIFKRVMNWHPLHQAAELAGQMLLAKADNAMPLFGEECNLTGRQQDYIKAHIEVVFREAASAAISKVKNFEREAENSIGRIVVSEMVTIPEKTMSAIGQSINRGAVLAMQAVQAKATNDDYDEILMRKTKHAGDITIPTRGVFISTNCVEAIKESINFVGARDVSAEVV